MNSKHTPGPWKANISETMSSTVTTQNGIGIARVVDDYDAHLIAAAPQMLEALETVAPLLHWLDQEQNVSMAGDMLHGKILAAISAAKGKV